MKIRLSDLWRWDGEIDRGPFIFWGLLLFAIKHNIDRLVASEYFHRPWSLFTYLITDETRGPRTMEHSSKEFYFVMAAIAIPFIWTGVCLTLRRLRAMALPRWLCFVFFVPFLNLIFFAVLSILPSRPKDYVDTQPPSGPLRAFFDRVIPKNPAGAAVLSVFVIGMVTALLVHFSVDAASNYGWGMFIGIPFLLGFLPTLIFSYHAPQSIGKCLLVTTIAFAFAAGILLAIAIEGLICIIMAFPIAYGISIIGTTIAFSIQRDYWDRHKTHILFIVLIPLVGLLTGAESVDKPEAPLIEVTTVMEIDAPPEKVWNNVVAFTELPPPEHFIFKLGVAYPLRAEIHGKGTGAIRHCVFSTGPFVEPIEVWDEPHLLKFSVTSQPPPMKELSPYDIHPPHLDNYLVSKGGQFKLIPLENGRTRIEATTWYEHNMWPARYWQVWSDIVIHRIHLRVLDHIKHLSESR